jgi:rubrerythrin
MKQMTSITFDELLKRATAFELRLESYYAEISDRTEDPGVKMLSFYLSRHRRHLGEASGSIEPEQLTHIGSIRLKFDIDFDPDSDLERMSTPLEEVKSRELLDAAIRYDSQLVRLYRDILEQPVGPEAKSFLESLIRLEEKDIVMLKKIVAMDYF